MLALLDDHGVSPLTVLDLLIGALDAHLNYDGIMEEVSNMVQRLRSSVVLTFSAFMLFGLGWCLLARLNDPVSTFRQASASFPALRLLFRAETVAGCLAFVVFLCAGIPIVWKAVQRAAAQRQNNVLRLFWTAVTCLALFIVSTVIVWAWHPPVSVLAGYLLVVLLLVVIGCVSVASMVAKSPFEPADLTFVVAPEAVLSFFMAATVALSAILIGVVAAHTPQLFQSQDVSAPIFIIGIVFMAVGTLVSGGALFRGVSKRSTH
jgi:hypothetical protein